MNNQKVSASVLKRNAVIEAIKAVAPNCSANFEIPMSAIAYIEYGNRLRKTPIRVSYNYVYNLMHEMLSAGVI